MDPMGKNVQNLQLPYSHLCFSIVFPKQKCYFLVGPYRAQPPNTLMPSGEAWDTGDFWESGSFQKVVMCVVKVLGGITGALRIPNPLQKLAF